MRLTFFTGFCHLETGSTLTTNVCQIGNLHCNIGFTVHCSTHPNAREEVTSILIYNVRSLKLCIVRTVLCTCSHMHTYVHFGFREETLHD